jgi:LPS export ABC transporter protein LptC
MKSRKSVNSKHVAQGILALVAVFIVAVATTLVVKSRLAQRAAQVAAPGPGDLAIRHAQIEEESDGVRWRLKADEALVFEREGRTAFRKLAVEVVEGDRSWQITGDEGELFQSTRNVEVRGRVVLTSSEGIRLETSVLRWQSAGRRLWTDAPVRLARQGAVIQGTALDVRMHDEVTTLSGRVHAVFAPDARR